jgi:hypothetical protein
MEAVNLALGEFKLPQLRSLATMLRHAEHQGNQLMHKTDVSSAFNNMLLSPTTALLHVCQFGDLVVVPLVAGFGWCATPAHYNVVAGAVDWVHNGGVCDKVLDQWSREQDRPPPTRAVNKQLRSITYIDDSCGQSHILTAAGDMNDLQTVICRLMGPSAYNRKKTEGPSDIITIIGWLCNLQHYTIAPSKRGVCKMFYWIFRGLAAQRVSLRDLQRAVGVLRWYSAVVPLAATHATQALITKAHRVRAAKLMAGKSVLPEAVVFLTLTAAVQTEIAWWRWILTAQLSKGEQLLSSPTIWYLAKDFTARTSVEVFSDTAGDIGGVYLIPDHTFGQF